MARSKKKKARQRARRQAARKARPQVNGAQPTQTPSESSPAGSKKAERLEKREAARQSRIEAVRRRKQAERRRRMMISGIALVIVLGLVAFFVWRSQRNKSALANETRAAGCTATEKFEAQHEQHIDAQNAPRTPYNSDPPTSGDHLGGYNPAWGDFDETLEPEQYVHNLEHGGTVLHYKDLDDEELASLQELADKWGAKDSLLIMPDPDVDKPVVMTAWAVKRSCERVSKIVIEAFIKEHCNKSPEKSAGCGAVA